MKELILLRGLPGSGKSTLAKRICNQHVEADMYFIEDGEYKYDADKIGLAHEWCQWKTENWMKMGYHICVSNTFVKEWEMEPYYKLAEQYGYRVHSLIVENRHDGKSVNNVPENTINKMKRKFQIKL